MSLLACLLAVASAHSKPDVLRSNIDPSVKPGVDFFDYANGTWLKKHPIPASESEWGIGNVVELELLSRLRKISEDAAKRGGKPGSDDQKVGDFWSTAMDEAKAEQAGLTPLKPELERIDAAAGLPDVVDLAFEQQRLGTGPFFEFDVSQDEKNSAAMAIHLNQGGLWLPDRDYYFNSDPDTVNVRKQYVSYIGQILVLSGMADGATAASDVMRFETDLARISRKLEDLRDPVKNYHRMPVDDLQAKLTPSIGWKGYLAKWGIRPSFAICGQPEFFTGLEALLDKTPLPTLKAYLRFHLVAAFAPCLDKEADRIDFQFNHKVLSGQMEPQPRWKRALRSENGAIGFVLGRIFVRDYFPPAEKERYSKLVEAVRQAYSRRIDRLTWMSPATKAKAHLKLAALGKKVGYPDKWKDYSKLVVGRNSYCENVMNANRWSFDDMLSKFGKPVDRKQWDMTPQTFNAYYDSSNNEIVLPAASFLVPGYRDAELDDAVVYGNMAGSWIGHEMTHGFDDEGRKYDARGNLKNWWTPEDAKRFDQRAQLMVKQFNAYQPLPGLHINGKACLGENIADYGGVLLGLDAFKRTEQFKRGRKLAGLTPLQRYFLAYTMSWLDEQRKESLRRQIMSDVHAPAKWRVNGPLSNIPDFYRAFGVDPGQPMWRPAAQRVHIW